jgi:uncharacterized lipoprotein YmbA
VTARPPRGAAWALTVLALGCSLAQPMPKTTGYVLEVTRQGPPGPGGGGVLRANRFRVAPRYERSDFVYRVGDGQYVDDFYHRFQASPGAAIRAGTIDWLRQSGLFASVLDAGGQEQADWLLEGQVQDLYGDLRDRRDPAAVLQLEIVLLDARSTDLNVAFRKYYGVRARAGGSGPEALHAAWKEALARVLADLEADLRAVVARRD